MQLDRILPGHPITQPFGITPSPALQYEPAGIFQRDAGGDLRRRAVVSPIPTGWAYANHYHDGLDIAAPIGTPIPAPADGTIIRCRSVIQAGATDANRYLAIRVAPNVAVWYWHLNDWAWSVEGKVVKRGDLIAHVGNTGLSTGPHTHAELRRLEAVETKYNIERFFTGGDLAIADDGSIVQGGTDMLAIVDRDPLAAPNPRQFTIKAGAIVNGYHPSKPNQIVVTRTFTADSSAHASHRCAISWPDGAQIPGGYPFLLVVDGIYAGLYIVELLKLADGSPAIVLDPETPATPTNDALLKATYNAGVRAAQDLAGGAIKP
jgi:murein DD-endopeptidase MepM/ murein hydrolase activator NlpD